MSDSESGPRRESRVRTARMEALSDGVFAIAITLLVLDLVVPEGSDDLLHALVHEWPTFLAYLVSFATIGAAWFAHTVISEFLTGATATLMRLNLFLLFAVSLLPFPTKLVATYISSDSNERVAVTLYGLCLLLMIAMISALWRYSESAGLITPDLTDEDRNYLRDRLLPGLAGYVVLILVGLVLPLVAVIGYLLIAVFLILPFLLLPFLRRSRQR